MPELRQNIITGEWVVIAPERSKRPKDFISSNIDQTNEASDPFEVDGPVYRKERLKEFETELVYVIPNKYPVFLQDSKNCSPRTYHLEKGFYSARPSTGGHDVVVVKDPNVDIYSFDLDTWYQLFSVAKKRIKYWHKDCNAEQAMLIYNQGSGGGASIKHPHAQIFVSNIIPNRIVQELEGAERYFLNHGKNVFQELIYHEKKEMTRIIAENDEFVAFTFYAARFPFEAWVLPKEQTSHFEEEKETYLHSLAQIMKDVFGRYGKLLNNPPLNFFLHDSPTSVGQNDYFRWHIEITPRLSKYGGYELGSGVIVDVMSPEEAAKYLVNS